MIRERARRRLQPRVVSRRMELSARVGGVRKPAELMRNFTPLRVLVVDDEPLIRWTLRRSLRMRGHTVTEGADAAGALRLAAEAPVPFDVLLLDYRLPDRQDLSLLRELRLLSPQTAIVMMTAYGDSRMREEAVGLGARTVIDKPFELADVIGLLEAVAG